MKKFEYLVRYSARLNQADLNELGLKGWGLVAVVLCYGTMKEFDYYFKREL